MNDTQASGNEISALKLADKSNIIYGNRPIEPRHLEVFSTYGSMASIRPVMKSHLDIVGSLSISGNRPITASHLNISEALTIMGNRPVASNDIDDPMMLMGYLD